MAEAQYSIALNLLRRKQTAPARQALQELIQKYPRTKTAREARDLLVQIPEEPAQLAAARPPAPPVRERAAGAVAPAARGGAATRRSEPPPAEPQQTERAGRMITSDDLAAGRLPSVPRRAAPSIPASLQSAQTGAAQGVKAAVQDQLRLLRAAYDAGQWVVDVEYDLFSAHTRPVYLGAWMRDENVSRRLGYTAAPMTAGRSTARIVLPGVPPDASNLRVVFFEEKGALFFTRDFTITK